MTLLIYYTLLYVHGFGMHWYILGFSIWVFHLIATLEKCK